MITHNAFDAAVLCIVHSFNHPLCYTKLCHPPCMFVIDLQEMSGDPLTCLVNENADVGTESSGEDGDEKKEAIVVKGIVGADEIMGHTEEEEGEGVEGGEEGGGGDGREEGGGRGVEGEEGKIGEQGEERGVEDGGEEGVEGKGGGGEGGMKEEGGGRKGSEGEETFSDINLATPTSDRQGLEFFDHNVTSSDSSGALKYSTCFH